MSEEKAIEYVKSISGEAGIKTAFTYGNPNREDIDLCIVCEEPKLVRYNIIDKIKESIRKSSRKIDRKVFKPEEFEEKLKMFGDKATEFRVIKGKDYLSDLIQKNGLNITVNCDMLLPSLPRTAYNIGKKFGYGKLIVKIDSDFKEYAPYFRLANYEVLAYGCHCKIGESLMVCLGIPKKVSDKEKEIRIAHEFGEIKFGENHPKIHRALKAIGSIPVFGEPFMLINESLADREARKIGLKIPYLYHLG
ncbi:MAG: hypothetical protein QXD43_01295 [Candidatus Aenigmatarchaeota archaeon]